MLGIALLTPLFGWSQGLVTGTVSDENGMPLPGATVFEQGTSNATTTNFDGNFTISTNMGVNLVVNYVGYETQEILVNSATINVILYSSQLHEVVVTVVAGPTDRRKLTVTVNKVTSEDLDWHSLK